MNPDKNDPNQAPEYTPKTIFSEPQAPAPTVVTPVYGSTPVATTPQPSKSAHKKGLIIAAGIGGAFIIVLIVIVVIIMATQKKTDTGTETKQQQAAILQPATEIELEQINNAISQDMSGLDDEKDYPAAGLEDKSLGL